MEDNRADVFLIREAIALAGLEAELHIAPDGDKAIRFFDQADCDESAPTPSLVILDINLPKKQGDEVLSQMRRSLRCAKALVVVVTSSNSERDRRVMADLGADEYFQKSSEYAEFMKLGGVIRDLLRTRGSTLPN